MSGFATAMGFGRGSVPAVSYTTVVSRAHRFRHTLAIGADRVDVYLPPAGGVALPPDPTPEQLGVLWQTVTFAQLRAFLDGAPLQDTLGHLLIRGGWGSFDDACLDAMVQAVADTLARRREHRQRMALR